MSSYSPVLFGTQIGSPVVTTFTPPTPKLSLIDFSRQTRKIESFLYSSVYEYFEPFSLVSTQLRLASESSDKSFGELFKTAIAQHDYSDSKSFQDFLSGVRLKRTNELFSEFSAFPVIQFMDTAPPRMSWAGDKNG
jgi:hypothetical protein